MIEGVFTEFTDFTEVASSAGWLVRRCGRVEAGSGWPGGPRAGSGWPGGPRAGLVGLGQARQCGGPRAGSGWPGGPRVGLVGLGQARAGLVGLACVQARGCAFGLPDGCHFHNFEGIWCKIQGWRAAPESNDKSGPANSPDLENSPNRLWWAGRGSSLVDRKHSQYSQLRCAALSQLSLYGGLKKSQSPPQLMRHHGANPLDPLV